MQGSAISLSSPPMGSRMVQSYLTLPNLGCTQAQQFRKLHLSLKVQPFFLNTIEIRLLRSRPLFINNTGSNFVSHSKASNRGIKQNRATLNDFVKV